MEGVNNLNRKQTVDNPLRGVPKQPKKKNVKFGSPASTEEVNIAKMKKQLDSKMNEKYIDQEGLNAEESDSDKDQEKKAAFKKIKNKIRKKINGLRTFNMSKGNDPEFYPANTDSRKYIDNLHDQEIKGSGNILAGFEDFLGLVEETPSDTIEVKPPVKLVPVKTEPDEEKKQNVEIESVQKFVKQPLPLQDFYSELNQTAKVGPNKPKLEPTNITLSYYIQLRSLSATYGGYAKKYDFISKKLPKNINLKSGQEPETLDEIEGNMSKLIPLSRYYEESMMRSVKPGVGERPCANGNNCEWFSMLGKVKVIGVECLNPDERLLFQQTVDTPGGAVLPPNVRPCILCRRREHTIHWLNARRSCGSISTKWLFQEYYNTPELDGEYCLKDCIMSSSKEVQNQIYPVVIHIRTRYRQRQLEEGVWIYEQVGYDKPEKIRQARSDFC